MLTRIMPTARAGFPSATALSVAATSNIAEFSRY
jgi:hypothetical protein